MLCEKERGGVERSFHSYTETEIFFWMWFNRQEAAETHCTVLLFLWVQDSQVSLWVFFFYPFLRYITSISSYRHFFRLLLQTSSICCAMIKGILKENKDSEQPVRFQKETWLLHNQRSPWLKENWKLVSWDISELLSVRMLQLLLP